MKSDDEIPGGAIDGSQTLRWFQTLTVYNPDGDDIVLLDREEIHDET